VATARPFDFRGPSLLTTAELRRARLRHEEFARSLATRLSIYLRLELAVQVAALETLPHPKFIEAAPAPVHLTLFRLEPLHGLGLVAVPPRLALGVIDRLLGGSGQAGDLKRDLTEIEVAVFDLVVQLLLKEWCRAVAGLGDARPEILGHETNIRFLPAAPRESSMLVLDLQVHFGGSTEPLQLGFPFAMVEPILRQPDALAQTGTPAPAAATASVVAWNPALEDVQVQLSAQWDGLAVTARQLATLKVGDIIPVQPDQFDRVEVRLARVRKFCGRLGATNQLRAVELTQALGPRSISAP
jgi:flagellar motor switch protein FliM